MADNDAPRGATLAFGIQKAKQTKVHGINAVEQGVEKHAITTFGGKQLIPEDEAQQSKKSFVIPKLENTFQVGVGSVSNETNGHTKKGFKPTFVPGSGSAAPAGGDDKFVQAAPTGPQVTTFGLQLRGNENVARAESGSGAGAILLAQQGKKNTERLADAAGIDEYEAMPIAEFGMAMLRGMGWSEGEGIGRNKEQEVKPIAYIARPQRLGLGAQPALLPSEVDKGKGGRPAAPDMVLPPDADGRQRSIRTLDEKLVPRAQTQPGAAPGKRMRVVAGPHAGLICQVLEVQPPEQAGGTGSARVRLLPSEEDVSVGLQQLGEPGEALQGPAPQSAANPASGSGRDSGRDRQTREGRSREGGRERERERGDREREKEKEREKGSRLRREGDDDERKHKKHREASKDRDREWSQGRGKDKDRDKDTERSYERDRRDKAWDKHHSVSRSSESGSSSGEEDAGPHGKEACWLAPAIKVRIVDKHVRGGRLYCKKGRVVDVHPGAKADVCVDDTGDTLTLPQSALETVVPKTEGATVLIVRGPFRLRKARLLRAHAADGVAAVQLLSDYSVQRMMLDDVAEFVGPVEEEEED